MPGNVSNLNNYSLAVSGEVFRWAIDFGSETILNRVCVNKATTSAGSGICYNSGLTNILIDARAWQRIRKNVAR